MITRAHVVDAVSAELNSIEGACRDEHRRIGDRVADRLGLADQASIKHPSSNPLDRLGTGVFVRRIGDFPIEVLACFDWACVAVIEKGRSAINRDPAWWADAAAAGVVLTAFDWLPPPATWSTGLEDAIAWSSAHGSICFVLDAEGPGPPKGWNGQLAAAQAFSREARRLCDFYRCGLGFTGFASLSPIFPGPTFLQECSDLAIPQPYDRHGAYQPGYGKHSVEGYRKLGATRIAIGRGAFVDPDGVGPDRARWRSPQEIARHRATTPSEGLVGSIWWCPVGKPSPRILNAIVQ